jgi:putative transposase
MHLSLLGEVVALTWRRIGEHFAGVELDECAIMPDHLHGILVLTPSVTPGATDGAFAPDVTRRKPLGGIIGAFKTRSTAEVNRLRGTPGRAFWQRDFWDRVIRDPAELERIRDYVRGNPASYRPRTFQL